MRPFLHRFLAFAGVIALAGRVSAQSAFSLCADSMPNRIVSTGPARAVIATVDSLRLCLAAEGFGDSAARHPRDWAAPSRLLILETRIPGDVRRMQESQVLISWTRNDRPLPNDSTAKEWRTSVVEVVAAKWDIAARRMERQELAENISSVLAQQGWIEGQIDTLRHKDDSLRLAVSEVLSHARQEKQNSLSAATRSESAARSSLSKAQSALAAATSSGDPGRIPSARASVAAAEDRVRAATERVRSIQQIVPENAVAETQDLLDRLDAKRRIATLTAMLTNLDADNRVGAWRATLEAIDSQPDPEERLRLAAARLRAILSR